MKFMKQATYIRYAMAKLSNFIQISMQNSSDPFLGKIFWKLKGPGTSFQVAFLIGFFDKNVSFVILHKLAEVHYLTLFISQVIQ